MIEEYIKTIFVKFEHNLCEEFLHLGVFYISEGTYIKQTNQQLKENFNQW